MKSRLLTESAENIVNVTEAQDNTQEREEAMLPVCYEILEMTIHVLSEEEKEEDRHEKGVTFDTEMLLRMQEALMETFKAILGYLKDIQVTATFLSFIIAFHF